MPDFLPLPLRYMVVVCCCLRCALPLIALHRLLLVDFTFVTLRSRLFIFLTFSLRLLPFTFVRSRCCSTVCYTLLTLLYVTFGCVRLRSHTFTVWFYIYTFVLPRWLPQFTRIATRFTFLVVTLHLVTTFAVILRCTR